MIRLKHILFITAWLVPLISWAQPVSVVVQANQLWQDSGIPISGGNYVSIWAKGIWAYGAPDSIADKWLGPEGGPQGGASDGQGFLMPGATSYTLICKIGSSGKPKAVGANLQFVADTSGDLFFAMNDNSFGDNYGYVVAFVYSNLPGITVSGVNDSHSPIIPQSFQVNQNFPNPFNPSTTISFDLSSRARVNITIYDIDGRKIQEMDLGSLDAGYHSRVWNGTNLNGISVASGVYFYQVKVGELMQAKKMLLLK